MLEVGSIVNGLVPSEPVEITGVSPYPHGKFYVKWTGKISHKAMSRMLTQAQIDALEIVAKEGSVNFKGDPEKFVLFAEAERIHSAYQFDPLFAINCSVVDALPHQVEAVYKYLLPQPNIRFLLADDTGAGKTIMTGLLVKELVMRGKLNRILIVTPGGLTKQWRDDEMELKFNIPFVIANRAVFSSEPTFFHNHEHIVTSIDFICREDVLNTISEEHWDMIIFDEAHKLSAYEYGERTYKSRRYEAAAQLSKQCEHLLLLTATPHRGRSDTFKRLLQLLDEDVFATADLAAERVKELSDDGNNKFFIRRLKEDMQDWDGNPLYKPRHTRTVAYRLTPEEEDLYNAVTDYLSKRKKEASESNNIHVSLALQVMQRRLVSSIFAIMNTLEKRYKALRSLVDELTKNPDLWKQGKKLAAEMEGVEDIDDYDDLDDEDRDVLDGIMSDPKKFKWFTTAKSPSELRKEAEDVEVLYNKAKALYDSGVEEQKFQKLKELLKSEQVVDGEKLVIFTEHKDTLSYLENRLKDSGYTIATIHGGKDADERRAAQFEFMGKAQILIATDAAGEGINLQFCRLLINWDIPWNPNRLEQRMGRIHRYGQQQEVMVFNMVADNTREGQVLETLLTKLDNIRDSLGDDRVYDVIQDVFKGIPLDAIIRSVFDGESTEFDDFINSDEAAMADQIKAAIKEQNTAISHTKVNYKEARNFKTFSDERRLQPIYIQLFFERAFMFLGGGYEEVLPGIYKITKIPERLQKYIRTTYKEDFAEQSMFCFDKRIFLDYRNKTLMNQNGLAKKTHYINPGNKLFDSLVAVVRNDFKSEMLKGTILISPEDKDPYFAYYVKSQVTGAVDPNTGEDKILDENLSLVQDFGNDDYVQTSPAKFLNMVPPNEFAKPVEPPAETDTKGVIGWSLENIAELLFAQVLERETNDYDERRKFLESGFDRALNDLDLQISELQGKQWNASDKQAQSIQEKLVKKYRLQEELKAKRAERLALLDEGPVVNYSEPDVLGCAYVVPLTQVEYKTHFGMSRDDEVEGIAMKVAMDYEVANGRTPKDVSADNVGYDVRSVDSDGVSMRYIEVKGRSGTDGVMLSENEKNRLENLGRRAWLYIVVECKGEPKLYCINDPIHNMNFEQKVKGVQFYLPLDEWQRMVNSAV